MGVKSTGSHPTTTKADGHLLEYLRNTFIEGGGGTNTDPLVGHSATGGVISDYTDPGPGTIYRSHVFTNSGTFSVSELGTYQSDVEVVIIGGGAGGGTDAGGGGGAGAFYPNPSVPISASPGSYTITIGAGGQGSDVTDVQGSDGSDTVAFGYTIKGGGGGGSGTSGPTLNGRDSPGAFGGSGGGGRRGNPAGSGGTYGNDGYAGAGPEGGGGGGGAGGNAPSSPSFQGGAGISNSIETGSAIIYAAGGTGGNEATPTGQNAGVPGGGGYGGSKGQPTPGRGGNGTSGLGAGGGGGGGSPAPRGGGNGGSGRVIIRYRLAESPGSAKASGGAISFYGGKTIHTFTTSGTFENTSGSPLTVDHIVIAGGGSGGGQRGGGGGAGGVRTSIPGLMPATADSQSTISPGAPNAVSVQVGGGAAAVGGPFPGGYKGITGTPSYFGTPLTAPGGGGGGGDAGNPIAPGDTGGSGGGAAGYSSATAGAASPNSDPNRFGYPGGTASFTGPRYGAGGGGGAGGQGQNGGGSDAGDGGIGIQLPPAFRNPESTLGAPGPSPGGFWFAGGGGGGIYNPGAPNKGLGGGPGGPYAGAGDGGAGGPGDEGGSAIANTGGGGGGGSNGDSPTVYYNRGGNGGSGLVLVMYDT